jgi:hypothetical protein
MKAIPNSMKDLCPASQFILIRFAGNELYRAFHVALFPCAETKLRKSHVGSETENGAIVVHLSNSLEQNEISANVKRGCLRRRKRINYICLPRAI